MPSDQRLWSAETSKRARSRICLRRHRLGGRSDLTLPRQTAVLGRALGTNDERADDMRATLERRADGILVATPFADQDSSLLVPLAAADCLLIREPFAPAAEAGSPCDILRLEF
jgi:molybdopterin molybdotransferase